MQLLWFDVCTDIINYFQFFNSNKKLVTFIKIQNWNIVLCF